MNDIELPAEPETPNPFAGMTAEQIAEHSHKLAAAMKPGERARAEAQEAVHKLALEVPSGRFDVVATPTEIARRRQMNNLGAAWCAIDNRLSQLDEESLWREAFYTNLQRCIESAYELGKHAAPEGEKARAAYSEQTRAISPRTIKSGRAPAIIAPILSCLTFKRFAAARFPKTSC